MRIIATVSGYKQVGENTFRDIHTSKIFSMSASIQEMLDWAKSTGIKNPEIHDLLLSVEDK